MIRADEKDRFPSEHGAPPTPKDQPEQEEKPTGVLGKIKGAVDDKIEERRHAKVYTLPDGRLCNYTIYKLVTEQGHEYLGLEPIMQIQEKAASGFFAWREFRPGEDSTNNPEKPCRAFFRAYTILRAGEGRPYDQVFMIPGPKGEPECIGSTPAASLLERLKRFEPGDIEKSEEQTSEQPALELEGAASS